MISFINIESTDLSMTKKEGEHWIVPLVGTAMNVVKSVFLEGFFVQIREEVENFLDEQRQVMRKELNNFQTRFMQGMFMTSMMIAAIAFLSVGVVLLLIDILGIPRSYSFLILGLGLLLGSIGYKRSAEIKNKLRKAEDASKKKNQKDN